MIHHYLQRGILPEKVLARPEIEKIFFLASAKKANDCLLYTSILTEEERALRKTFEPYYDVLKTPSLSPDAPEEAVKAYKKYNELYDKKRAEAEAWLLETKVTFNKKK